MVYSVYSWVRHVGQRCIDKKDDGWKFRISFGPKVGMELRGSTCLYGIRQWAGQYGMRS